MNAPIRLLWITPPEAELTRVREILRALQSATLAGSVALLLRRKRQAAKTRALLEQGRELRCLTEKSGVRLLVSRRVDIALAIRADGVHLPENGMLIEQARQLIPWVSASRHDADGVQDAEAMGAKLCTLSPLFETPGKGAALGEACFRSVVSSVPSMQVAALGGVLNATTAMRAKEAGATAVATIRGVQNVEDVFSLLSPWLR